MKTKIIIGLIAISFLWSCATSMKYTWTKENFEGKHFNKILVLTITKNLQSRTQFENTVVKYLSEEGINATNSLSVFSPVEDSKSLTKEAIAERIKKGNYDGVLVTSLIDVNTQDVRVDNSAAYNPMPYAYGYRGYIYSGYGNMYAPDYYRQQKTYVLESRLYDVNIENPKEAIVWSGQSSLTDPYSSDSASKTYADKLVNTLIKSGTIKK